MTKPRTKPVKRSKPKKGGDLFNHVVRLSGIPGKTIQRELKGILDRQNIDIDNLTVDQLRRVVASYLREIMGTVLDRCTPKKQEN